MLPQTRLVLHNKSVYAYPYIVYTYILYTYTTIQTQLATAWRESSIAKRGSAYPKGSSKVESLHCTGSGDEFQSENH